MAYINRRNFLTSTGALGFASGLGVLGGAAPFSSVAAETSGYKALVCIFLFGGMDHADTILPHDQTSYDQLSDLRLGLFDGYGVGSGTSSRDRDNLLLLSPNDDTALGGRDYGLPQELGPLHSLFNSEELAIVGSVGPLVQPTTREQIDTGTAALPTKLFSHNDQQSTWQALDTEGAIFGWGGRFVDAVLASDPTTDARFAAISSSGNVFLSGQQAQLFTVPASGPRRVRVVHDLSILGEDAIFDEARLKLFDHFRRSDFGAENSFSRDFANLQSNGVSTGDDFANLFEGNATVNTAFPDTGLGAQLGAIANTISIRGLLGTSRQVFFASAGGFDTHSKQTSTLPALHSQIAEAISAFRDAMIELGVWNDVTLFTASDFGRTLNDNGDGTDHGWAGHHFVAGGSVQGKNVFGNLPSSDPDSDEYTGSRARLIPAVSVEQYAATLGNWFGLGETELNEALPNLANFNVKDLGFLTSQS